MQLHTAKISIPCTGMMLRSFCNPNVLGSMEVHQENCQTFSTTRTDGNQNQADSWERRNLSKIQAAKIDLLNS